jgi:hypothetical protein
MQCFKASQGKGEENRHLVSEAHMRVQVITIPHAHEDGLFDRYHGELLIQVLDGSGLLKTVNSEITMQVGDQALLMNGEGFSLGPTAGSSHV